MVRHRKNSFSKKTEPQIRNGKNPIEIDPRSRTAVFQAINQINPENEYVIIKRRIIPTQYSKFFRKNRQFALPLFPEDSLEKALEEIELEGEKVKVLPEGFEPSRMIVKAYENNGLLPRMGYSYPSIEGPRNIPMRILLRDVLEGARLYAYQFSNTFGVFPFELEIYDATEKVNTHGAEVHVRTSSRTEGSNRYEFRIFSFPIKDTESQRNIAFNLETDHHCKAKEKREIHLDEADNPELTPRQAILDPHECSAIYTAIRHFTKQGNLIPFKNCPIPIPSENLARIYNLIDNNVLIKEEGKLRRTRIEDQEVLLTWAVNYLGPKKSLNAKGNKLQDYAF